MMPGKTASKPLDPNKRLIMAVAYINQMHRSGAASAPQQASR